MSLIQIIFYLVAVGFLLFAVNSWLPIDGKIKSIINAIVIFVVILWLLTLFFPGLNTVRIGP